ncbi:MAG: type II secretion system F family protein [Lentisphaeria bacterium]|nr:type II secretion system F family protein [Lentisphaeria bacterium]
MENWINCLLIFGATSLFFFIVISLTIRYLQERLEFKRSAMYEKVRRFIEPQKLLSRQIFFALISACVIFILQLAFGVEKMVIAIPVSCAFAIFAFFMIFYYYIFKLQKRNELFEAKILDFTMGVANGMRSGLALGQAVEAYSKRLDDCPMKEELVVMLREYRLGVDLPEAFERMYRRMPSEDLHLLVTTVSLTTKSGGSLVEVLEEMIETIRERTEFQGRLKNMTAQGKFEALVISCAPLAAFLLIYFIEPNLMEPLVTTGTGWIAIGVAAALVTCGYFVLKKIITVEV